MAHGFDPQRPPGSDESLDLEHAPREGGNRPRDEGAVQEEVSVPGDAASVGVGPADPEQGPTEGESENNVALAGEGMAVGEGEGSTTQKGHDGGEQILAGVNETKELSANGEAKGDAGPAGGPSVPPPTGGIQWSSIKAAAFTWLKDPMNLAMLVWIVAVAVSGGILFMAMTGMLNQVLPNESVRKSWGEACNQVLTALFTLYVLLVQPWRIIYVIWLVRWKVRDRRRLRSVLSRSGPDHPVRRERTHMAIVVALLNLNCAFQYCLAGVVFGISMNSRSGLLVGLLLAGAIGAVACAGLYCLFSPLGRPNVPQARMSCRFSELDLPSQALAKALEEAGEGQQGSDSGSKDGVKRAVLDEEEEEEEGEDSSATAETGGGGTGSSSDRSISRSVALIAPFGSDRYEISIPEGKDLQWDGHIWECYRAPRTFWSVLFCFCCTFGNNLKRAGFGSQYLHAVMLILFLITPFLVCEFAALQISDKALSKAIFALGLVVSYFGLLYGGYWRHQLSRVFRLPAPKLCGSDKCGIAGDCFLWLVCCACALCQEVRTVNALGLHVKFDDLDAGKTSQPKEGGTPTLVTIAEEGGETKLPPQDQTMDCEVEA